MPGASWAETGPERPPVPEWACRVCWPRAGAGFSIGALINREETNPGGVATAAALPAAAPAGVRGAFEAADEEGALAYARGLARSHYENFSVVSALLPRRYRQDFCNIYAFCRVADDLADEVGDPGLSLRLLAEFRELTQECFAGRPRGAVFVALRRTVEERDIPPEPFLDLIDAFEQDQRVNRYDTFEQLVGYCRRSADPVGRLVLYVTGYRDEERQRLSDATCTALQLTNFWQDVRRDLAERDRIYIPRESMAATGVTEEQLRAGRCDDAYRRMILAEVERTEGLFRIGDGLLPLLRPEVRRQVGLFGAGGRAILRAIARQGYDTLTRRPRLSGMQKGRLMLRALAAGILQPIGPGEAA